jgi:hypothetical protein
MLSDEVSTSILSTSNSYCSRHGFSLGAVRVSGQPNALMELRSDFLFMKLNSHHEARRQPLDPWKPP